MNFVALRMLTGDTVKYVALIFAIAFSAFLLENQTSIFAGIMIRTGSQIYDVVDADVWVMDPSTKYFEETKALKDTDLTRVRGVSGVDYATRLFKAQVVARTPGGNFSQGVMIGVDDATLIGAPRKMLLGDWHSLRQPDSVIVDKPGYLLLFPNEPLALGRTLEMNDHLVHIVGISDASPPFTSFPILHSRYSEAVNFVGRERSQMSFVVARPQPGLTPGELARRISQGTGLRARTTNQFRWDCVNYYLHHTGIPVNFGITIAIALIIGLVVSGQTFYLFTVENLKQFAALKAIGVTNRRLVGMIVLQALTVGFIGYAMGTGMAAAFFEFFSRQVATHGIILLWQNAVGVAVAIFAVVIAASLLSIRRVLVLEPATVFR